MELCHSYMAPLSSLHANRIYIFVILALILIYNRLDTYTASDIVIENYQSGPRTHIFAVEQFKVNTGTENGRQAVTCQSMSTCQAAVFVDPEFWRLRVSYTVTADCRLRRLMSVSTILMLDFPFTSPILCF